MSKYLEGGYLYFPPIIVGGPTGDYVTKCPLDSAEEAEIQIVTISTEDTGTPHVFVSGDFIQPGASPIAYDGSLTLGARNTGTDQGAIYGSGIALAGSGTFPKAGNNVFFPLSDSLHRCFIRIDCAASNAVFVTLQYRVRPVRAVVGDVATVHHDNERAHNLAREEQAIQHLQARTIKSRGEAINI